MLSHRVSTLSRTFFRLLLAVLALPVLALSLSRPASAASPSFSIASVKADQSVTVHTKDFPANVNFTIRMDKAGNMAIDGIVVGETNSGNGGAFEVTYNIPAELRGVKTIAIRFESKEGYYTYNWFNNRSSAPAGSTPVPTATPGATSSGSKTSSLNILSVDANKSATVEAVGLPKNTTFTVRVGPYYTFSKDYVKVPSVTTDANGYVKFTFDLPSVVKDVELVALRLDGGGRYFYNAFKNVDGYTTTIPVTSTSICQITSVTPGSSVSKNADFDAVWTVKNVSGKTWDGNSVDYKYISGTKTYKHDSVYDLHQTVKSGDSIKVVVDMTAPNKTGTFNTTWALVQGGTTLCNLPISLTVK